MWRASVPVRHSRRSNWSERQERVAPTFEKSPRQLKPISQATFATKSAKSELFGSKYHCSRLLCPVFDQRRIADYAYVDGSREMDGRGRCLAWPKLTGERT